MKKFDKALKVLWFINGIIIFTAFSIVTYQLIDEILPRNYNYRNNDLIVGDKLDEAKKKGLALQGLSYSEPKTISSSDLMYMTVSVDTYKEPMINGILDTSKRLHVASSSTYGNYDELNLIFLDSSFQVIRTLLDKKANIKVFRFDKADTTYSPSINDSRRHIAYEIAFKDTNNDGYLNRGDDHDLYLSNLNGQGLMQITQGIDIDDFKYRYRNSQLFITYFERGDVRQEHKRKKFAIYDIATKELSHLSDLDKAITELENQLVN